MHKGQTALPPLLPSSNDVIAHPAPFVSTDFCSPCSLRFNGFLLTLLTSFQRISAHPAPAGAPQKAAGSRRARPRPPCRSGACCRRALLASAGPSGGARPGGAARDPWEGCRGGGVFGLKGGRWKGIGLGVSKKVPEEASLPSTHPQRCSRPHSPSWGEGEQRWQFSKASWQPISPPHHHNSATQLNAPLSSGHRWQTAGGSA